MGVGAGGGGSGGSTSGGGGGWGPESPGIPFIGGFGDGEGDGPPQSLQHTCRVPAGQ